MKRTKYFLLALITLLLTISESCEVNFQLKLLGSTAVAQTTNDSKAEADRLLEQGVKQSLTSQFSKALQSWEQSLAIYREIGDRQGVANSLLNLGNAYGNLGDHRKAIDYHQQSLAIFKEIGNRQGVANSLVNLGNVYFNLGDYRKAKDYQEQSLAIFKEIGNRLGVTASLLNLGNAYGNLGDHRKAIDYHQQSLAIFKEIGNRQGVANSLVNLGNAYLNLGDYRKAIDYHQQSLAIFKEIGNRQGVANSLGNLGNAYLKLGDYRKAIDYYQQSLAIFKEIGVRGGEAASLNNLGDTLRLSGKLTAAENNLNQAIVTLEDIRKDLGSKDTWKVSIFEEQARSYLLLQQVLVDQKRPQEALVISEQGRTRALVEILFRRINQKAEELLIPPTPNLVEIQQIAQQQNATLVEYSITLDDEIYIWVIPPKGKIQFRSIKITKNICLSKLVEVSLYSIGVRGRNSDISLTQKDNPSKSLRQLHQLLIKPIADLLPQNEQKRVIFIPHQELFFVPFAALQDDKDKYLIEKHTILTAPSIQALSLTQKDKQVENNPNIPILPRGESALIIGNPTMSKQGVGKDLTPLEPLPGAETEAKNIASKLGTKAIIGDQATESAIVQKMASAKLIHFATHALLDYDINLLDDDINAIDSPGAIALSPSSKDDGFLTSSEIMERFGLPGKSPLQADLVVLSACDTGRGDIRGEGVIGLARAFMASGVPTLVVSLWKVPDDDTVKLMTEFYTSIYDHKFDKAKAMREAMLTMLRDDNGNPDPKAWAAFTVIGKAE